MSVVHQKSDKIAVTQNKTDHSADDTNLVTGRLSVFDDTGTPDGRIHFFIQDRNNQASSNTNPERGPEAIKSETSEQVAPHDVWHMAISAQDFDATWHKTCGHLCESLLSSTNVIFDGLNGLRILATPDAIEALIVEQQEAFHNDNPLGITDGAIRLTNEDGQTDGYAHVYDEENVWCIALDRREIAAGVMVASEPGRFKIHIEENNDTYSLSVAEAVVALKALSPHSIN